MKRLIVGHKWDLELKGSPSLELSKLSLPKKVAVSPVRISGVKPRLLVQEGASVHVGTPLFEDKQDERIRFMAPASGTVSEIVYGERRCIEAIVIDTEKKPSYREYSSLSEEALASISKDDLKARLIEMGLWSFFRAFPFSIIPSPEQEPPAIFISLDDDEPFKPKPESYLKGKEDVFKLGLKLLKILAPQLYLTADLENDYAKEAFKEELYMAVEGPYPANQTGTVLYHSKQDSSLNAAWTINPQDLLLLTEALISGQYPREKIVTLGGSQVATPQHYRVAIGTPVSEIVDTRVQTEVPLRYVIGGLFTGYKSSREGYLSYFDDAIQVIPEGEPSELLSFFRPGLGKTSFSNAFISAALPKNGGVSKSTSLSGSDRDCISCGYCPQVCPVELQPQFLFKHLVHDDSEEAIKQGLLDCVDCGLCTYVCPSKIELADTFSQTKSTLLKELSS